MEHKSTTKRRKTRSKAARALIMSQRELAGLGDGQVAYIRIMSTDEALKLYPAVKGLPEGISVFALHSADGTPLTLTDSRQAAIGHAMGDKLSIASLH